MPRITPCENLHEYFPWACQVTEDILEPLNDLYFLREEPYIIARYVGQEAGQIYAATFCFQENCNWFPDVEDFFFHFCLKNEKLRCNEATLDRIYKYYSAKYPQWHLKRYHTHGMRMLDHIYHCLRQGTAQEMLYKAELDVLAENVPMIDELNLLATKPSEVYGGLTVRVLRAMNCDAGAELLSDKKTRNYLLQLQKHFPDLFDTPLNDSQCKYLKHLIDGGLLPGETGRLFRERKLDLQTVWEPYLYGVYVSRGETMREYMRITEEISQIDPIFKQYFQSLKTNEAKLASDYQTLQHYLLVKREECDKMMRRVNRKHDASWQQRRSEYIIRYPQTIRDFCREAIYMRNCLLAYTDAVLHNYTTILFLRLTEDVNKPFITIEIQNNELKQAYHRYNEDCTPEEAAWITDFCEEHGISTGNFHFDQRLDLLM